MLKNMVAYEVALAGLMYAGSITIKAGCHDYHVGLMIDALSQLAAQPLGGKGAKGLGRYNLTAMINQACLRPRDRFWDIPVPKIDSAFDNLFVPQPSWSPSTTQQLYKLVAAPYLPPMTGRCIWMPTLLPLWRHAHDG